MIRYRTRDITALDHRAVRLRPDHPPHPAHRAAAPTTCSSSAA